MLREILAVQPGDAFARYGLAMALSEAGQVDEALGEFGVLRDSNPDYVPGYQMAGQLLAKLGREDEARAWLEAGIGGVGGGGAGGEWACGGGDAGSFG
jgi:cytochrome c-type biogenesis protein CcmH/NrfG